MISGSWWNTMPKKKVNCHNLGKFWYPASHYKMEHLLLLFCCFRFSWVLFAQKYTVLLSRLQGNAAVALYSQQWTQKTKVTKVYPQMSSQKPWSFQPKAHKVSRSWTGADTVLQSASMTKKTQDATIGKLFEKLNQVNNSLYEVELAKAHIEHRKPILVGFLFFNTKNCECWSKTITFSPNSVMYTSSKIWKWTQTCCVLPLPRSIWKIVPDQKWERNGRVCNQLTLSIVSLLMM